MVAEAEPLRFQGKDGADVHSLYYAPANDAATAPHLDLPPLLVVAHGGPTGAAEAACDPKLQFWTSRGFAVLAVNYRGSVNYGRDYRERLAGQWGVLDAADCAAGAQHLVEEGLAHPRRVAIRGNSAGGLTVLSAMCRYSLFAAGASYYGISDLERLARDTHKFESHYLESLIGPWPECRRRYRERSAIHRVAEIQAPLIFFQGLEDRVVPPQQTRAMVRALRQRGIEARELLFNNEGHGFRRSENIRAALEAELKFYLEVFGLLQ
jgi:dipeptidyl aminopeptidase/acylaminoacyl peptidase